MTDDLREIRAMFNAALRAVVAALLVTGAIGKNEAAVYSLDAVADGRIFVTDPNKANDTTSLSVYTNTSTPNVQRSVIQFDLSGLPAGSIVGSATLTLTSDNLDGTYTNSSGLPMEVYRLTQSWVEGQVTATDRDWGANGVNESPGDDHPWNNLGGDYVGTTGLPNVSPYATSNATGTVNGPITWDVTQLVSEWYTGSSPNCGILLLSDNGNRLHFHSSEHSSGNGPVLTLTLVPEPATASLAVMGLIGLGAYARRRNRSRQRPDGAL